MCVCTCASVSDIIPPVTRPDVNIQSVASFWWFSDWAVLKLHFTPSSHALRLRLNYAALWFIPPTRSTTLNQTLSFLKAHALDMPIFKHLTQFKPKCIECTFNTRKSYFWGHKLTCDPYNKSKWWNVLRSYNKHTVTVWEQQTNGMCRVCITNVLCAVIKAHSLEKSRQHMRWHCWSDIQLKVSMLW